MRTTTTAKLAWGSALLFLGLGIANAGDTDTRFYVAPMVTYTSIDEDTFDPDDAFGGQIALGKRLSKHLALELSYWRQDGADLEDPATSSGEVDEEGYQVSARIFPLPDLASVYITTGVGAGTYDFDQVTTSRNVGDINDQDADFYDLGIGYQVPITQGGIKLRGEYRYRSTDVDQPLGPRDYVFRDNVVALGLEIPLGARPDRAEPVPAPPPEPEPEPKTMPPVDSDGDGVIDRRDDCPGTSRGTEVDGNGCAVEKKEDEPIVLRGVRFEFDSARLTGSARDTLQDVVETLKAHPDIYVRLGGHTDSIGPAEYNMNLSVRRAESVKDFLIEHGIDPKRLTTRGYGETQPVAPNTKPDGSDNPEGRAKNRRVEINVVDQ